MSERRNFSFLLMVIALLLAPFAMAIRPALAVNATYIVTSTADTLGNCAAGSATCTLRQAITDANSDSVNSTISFDQALANSVITLADPNIPLPDLSADGTTIDGIADRFLSNSTQVALNGNGSLSNGLTITGSGNTIQGLSIYGFLCSAQGAGGIVIEKRQDGSGGSGNTIERSYIGLNLSGAVPAVGQQNCNGIVLRGGASANHIQNANVIGGNQFDGILIQNSQGNVIQGNLIGVLPPVGVTNAVVANQQNGIELLSTVSQQTSGNLIGGVGSSARNVISGNGSGLSFAGVRLSGPNTTSNTLNGNYIGLNSNGNAAIGNSGDGVLITNGAKNNTLDGSLTAVLAISGNVGNGIRVTGNGTSGNVISGVYVGTNNVGTAALANTASGILIDNGASTTTVTGGPITNRTIISGNTGPGVQISGPVASGNTIDSALIGISGTSVGLPNVGGGVLVEGGAQRTTLSGNTISGNTGFGVRLDATKTVTITGNLIGLDTALTGAVPNTGPGIDVLDASNDTLIGSADSPNHLAGNSGAAISIVGTQTLSTTVSNNTIGLLNNGGANGGTYNVAATNASDGVLISGGPQKTTVTGNTIGSHPGSGVNIVGSATTTATLSLNKIGWAVTSAANPTPLARANAAGITINAAHFVDVLTNTLRFNTGDAVAATGVLTVTMRSNVIIGQTIGAAGTGNGVLVAGASRNVQVLSNTITLNAGQATLVRDTSQQVSIQYNRITGNNGGVLLEGTQIYDGGPADPDTTTLPKTSTLPNHGIDPPIFDLGNANPLRLRLDQNGVVSGWVYTDTNRVSSCLPVTECRIQFFRSNDGSSDNQGFLPVLNTPEGAAFAADFATPDDTGYFSGQLSDMLPLPDQLLFAATDGAGNTSEFGVLNVTPSLSMDYLSPPNGQQNAAPGQTVNYTLRLVNSGTIDFRNLNLTTGNTLARWITNPLNGSTNLLSLPANSTKTITVSLTLPSGTDPNVQAGIKDTTFVTATVSNLVSDLLTRSQLITTTVVATPVVEVSTVKGSGTAAPGGHVTHTYRYTNSGNVAVTLDLTQHTVDPADSGFVWATALSKSQVTIASGASADVDVTVTVPLGAQVEDVLGKPIRVTTFVTATAKAPYSSIVRVTSSTTGAKLVPNVLMGGDGQSDSAASNAEIAFFHNVTNTSNGKARFCLNYRSNSGSQVVSYLSQNSVQISGNCFTLETGDTNPKSILRFKAVIQVTGKLLPQESDRISIYLTSVDTGLDLANGSVTDTVIITSSPLLPRIWLPMIAK